MRLNKNILLFSVTLLFSVLFTFADKASSQLLTGQEILFEIEDAKGKEVNGIYAFDPSKQVEDNFPFQLIIPRGHAPQWSPHHKRFSYVFNADLWISDLNGDKAAISPAIPTELQQRNKMPIRWTLPDLFSINFKTPGWGNSVFWGFALEALPIAKLRAYYSPIWRGAEGVYPIIPVTKPVKTFNVGSGEKLSWQDVLTINNATTSQDGQTFAAETYPADPFDLKRTDSKIKLYRLIKWSANKEEFEKQLEKASWYSGSMVTPPIDGPGIRLTDLDVTNTELNPLWSPDGKWIAFTVVNYEKGYCVPAVIRPDGTRLTYLTIPVPDGPFPFSPEDAKWQLVDKEIKPINTSITSHIWGDVNLMAVKWSADGKYLWIEKDRASVLVAKLVDGKWQMRQCVEETGANSFGITNIAYNGSQVAWLEDSGDSRKIFILNTYDVETNKRQSWRLRSGLVFHAIDW